MSCGNNIRQLGLAMHNYHDANKTFPPGLLNAPEWTYLLYYIMPYIEQTSLHAGLDQGAGHAGAAVVQQCHHGLAPGGARQAGSPIKQ